MSDEADERRPDPRMGMFVLICCAIGLAAMVAQGVLAPKADGEGWGLIEISGFLIIGVMIVGRAAHGWATRTHG